MRPARALAVITPVLVAAACLPGSGPAYLAPVDGGPPTGPTLADDAGGVVKADVDLGDPFGIDGLVPSHGPWTGGTRAELNGRGFTSTLRVWIGATELDASAIFASDPSRAAIQTPPGAPGAADVRIRDDASAQERVLPAGFFYDAFVIVPNSGATSGGTRIGLEGSGTSWTNGLTVAIGSAACTDVAVVDATHVQCTTPAGSPGTTDVTVTSASGAPLQARDAFTYSDSPDGYRGGLAGDALAGSLRVLAYDADVGTAIAGAHAIAGGDLATAVTGLTGANGVVTLSDPSLTGKVTVTIAAKCHQPFTFVDVPVDTVTAYLSPVIDPSCGSGDPPSSAGQNGQSAGEIDGELVWPGGIEFARANWTTVPGPTSPGERLAAYVFGATGSPLDSFVLPAASAAVTPDSPGVHGYGYAIDAAPGNQTIYALAGIEDRTYAPPRFVPYTMGVARGVSVQPGVRTTGADILMETLLDHQVTLAPAPPAPTTRGPDRLFSQLGVSLGLSGYAVFPAGARTDILPLGGANIAFTGVPSLDGALTGEAYFVASSAATGAQLSAPASVVARVRTTDTNDAVAIGGFLQPPAVTEPSAAPWTGTQVAFQASGAYDVALLTITSGNGLVVWTIVAPNGSTSFEVPDLSAISGDPVGLVPGAIQTLLYVARVDSFEYATLRSGQLGSGSWSAFAYDVGGATY